MYLSSHVDLPMLAQLLSQSLQHTNTCYTTTHSTSCLRLLALWLFHFSESALSFCTDLKIEQCLRFGLKWTVNIPRQARQRQKQVKKSVKLDQQQSGQTALATPAADGEDRWSTVLANFT